MIAVEHQNLILLYKKRWIKPPLFYLIKSTHKQTYQLDNSQTKSVLLDQYFLHTLSLLPMHSNLPLWIPNDHTRNYHEDHKTRFHLAMQSKIFYYRQPKNSLLYAKLFYIPFFLRFPQQLYLLLLNLRFRISVLHKNKCHSNSCI